MLGRSSYLAPVEPRVFDLLEFLIRNRDHVVSKDDLIATVWNGRIISESALTTRINAARQAVADSGEQQRLIRTVPRKGFRFVGEVRGEDKRRLIAGADAFALASHSEGLPVAALEAMAAGLPVLLTPGCNLPEIAAVDAGLIVAPEAGVLAAGLARLFADPERLPSHFNHNANVSYRLTREIDLAVGLYNLLDDDGLQAVAVPREPRTVLGSVSYRFAPGPPLPRLPAVPREPAELIAARAAVERARAAGAEEQDLLSYREALAHLMIAEEMQVYREERTARTREARPDKAAAPPAKVVPAAAAPHVGPAPSSPGQPLRNGSFEPSLQPWRLTGSGAVVINTGLLLDSSTG